MLEVVSGLQARLSSVGGVLNQLSRLLVTPGLWFGRRKNRRCAAAWFWLVSPLIVHLASSENRYFQKSALGMGKAHVSEAKLVPILTGVVMRFRLSRGARLARNRSIQRAMKSNLLG